MVRCINGKCFLYAALAIWFTMTVASGQGIGWKLVEAKIHHDFPGVARLQTGELSDWLRDKSRPQPHLLDVRTEAEFAVSHLKDARRVEPGAEARAVSLPKDQPIVTYCSVGYRSAAFAEKLKQAGYTQVTNLEGSIFRWANENRPLVRDGKPTDKVHPYNALWDALLQKSHRAENAPSPQPDKSSSSADVP